MAVRRRDLLPLLLTVSIGSWAHTAADSVPEEDIRVTVSPLSTATGVGHGYVEYDVSVTNRSATNAHQVTVVFPDIPARTGGYRNGPRIGRVARTILAEPESTVTTSLLHPALEVDGFALRVEVDGRRMERSVPLRVVGWNPYRPIVLASLGVVKMGFTGAAEEAYKDASGGAEKPELANAGAAAADWSENWLGYTCWDGIVVTADEMRQMNAGARAAVDRYVRAGGSLLVLGATTLPARWAVEDLPPLGIKRWTKGFGECSAVEAPMDLLTKDHWTFFRDAWLRARAPWSAGEDVAGAEKIFSIIGDVQRPVKGLSLLMILFVITIGPVNLYVLQKMKRRMWLLWTIPSISILTAGTVAVYAIVAEGFDTLGRIESITILDESDHLATTIGRMAFYAPLTLSGALRFSPETEVTPIPEGFDFGSAEVVTIDWTRGQDLTSGWVRARLPAHFRIRKCELRRERIDFTPDHAGALMAVNGLGCAIERLWVADQTGRIYMGAKIPPGVQVSLEAGGQTASLVKDPLRALYATGFWSVDASVLTAAPRSRLQPACYIAELAGTPFLESPLRGAVMRNQTSIVYGLSESLTRIDPRDGS